MYSGERWPRFVAMHALAISLFCAVYATSWIWLDVARGQWTRALQAIPHSPVLVWNLCRLTRTGRPWHR